MDATVRGRGYTSKSRIRQCFIISQIPRRVIPLTCRTILVVRGNSCSTALCLSTLSGPSKQEVVMFGWLLQFVQCVVPGACQGQGGKKMGNMMGTPSQCKNHRSSFARGYEQETIQQPSVSYLVTSSTESAVLLVLLVTAMPNHARISGTRTQQ